MAIKVSFEGSKKLLKELARLEQAPKKALHATLSDVRKRAPGWVAQEVSKVYGIKKSDITSRSVGDLEMKGNGLSDLELHYSGRQLTPIHFSMTPKTPPAGHSYTLKAAFIRGKKETIGEVKKLTKKQRQALGKNFRKQNRIASMSSPYLLMGTKAKSDDKVQYIPFQRREEWKSDKTPRGVRPMKNISLPQMIDGRARPGIEQAINENVEKRLTHNMNRFLK